MSKGIYAAVSGATARQRQLDTVSHNLANVDTAGYRRLRVIFEERIADASGLTHQVTPGERHVDHSQGEYEQTGRPLDVAIQGPGFFTIQTPQGTALTRDGRFQLTQDGQLVTLRGEPVLNAGGQPIQVPVLADELMIDSVGLLYDGFGDLDQLGVVEVDDVSTLRPMGPGRYSAPGDARPSRRAEIQQGMLEGANVDPVEGMTDLITLHRHFDAMHQLIQSHRDLDRRSVQLGRVSG